MLPTDQYHYAICVFSFDRFWQLKATLKVTKARGVRETAAAMEIPQTGKT